MKKFSAILIFLCCSLVFGVEQDPNAIATYLNGQLPSNPTIKLTSADVRKAIQDIYDTSRLIADEYRGDYNASTNTPSLANGTGNKGDWYTISVAGTRDFGAGGVTFAVNDEVWYTGTIWKKRSSGTSGGASNFKGLYDAIGNVPTISDSTGVAGDTYIVNTLATSTSISGVQVNLGSGDLHLFTGDILIHDGFKFQAIPVGRNRQSVISLDWYPFNRGLGITVSQAMTNSDLLEAVKNIAGDVTQHELNPGVIQLTGSGPYEFSDTIDNLLYGVSGTAQNNSNYGTLTYNAAANTLVRSTGTWASFTVNRHIKIRDAANVSNCGMWMIASISGTTMTLRRDEDALGSDDYLGTSVSSTTAVLTPYNSVSIRSDLSLKGSSIGGWVLKKQGKGTALKRHSHYANTWTTARIPGGASASLLDTYYQYNLELDGLTIISTDGTGIWVESGDHGSSWHIGSVRVNNRGTANPAVHFEDTYAGTATDLYIGWTGGDGIQMSNANAINVRARIEGAGGDGMVGSGTGNTLSLNIERCAGIAVDLIGTGNHISGYFEGNNSDTANSPSSSNPLDGNSIPIQSTVGAQPEIRIGGTHNTVNARSFVRAGNSVADPQFLNPIEYRDVGAIYSTNEVFSLPKGFDVYSKAKAWTTSPWPDKVAYLSLERLAKWHREHGIIGGSTGFVGFNYPSGGNTATLVSDKIKVTHAVGGWDVPSASTRTVLWLDQMLGSTEANAAYDTVTTNITGVSGADVTFVAYSNGYTPAYITRGDTGGNWISDGFKEGMKLTITLSASNNITTEVVKVTKSNLYVLSQSVVGGTDEDVTFVGRDRQHGENLSTFTVNPGDYIFFKVRYSNNQWAWFQGLNNQLHGADFALSGGEVPLITLAWGSNNLAHQLFAQGPGIQEYTGYVKSNVATPFPLGVNAFHLVTCTEPNATVHGAVAATSPAMETWIHSLEIALSDSTWNGD